MLVFALPISTATLAWAGTESEHRPTSSSAALGPSLELTFPPEGALLELYTDRLLVIHQSKNVADRADRTLHVQVSATNATNFSRDDHLHFGFDLEGNFTASTYGGLASLCYALDCPIGVDKLSDGAHVLELRIHRKDHSSYTDPDAGREVHLTLVKFDRAFAAAPSNDLLIFAIGAILVGSIVAAASVVFLMRRARRASCIVEDVFLIYHDGRLIEEAHRVGPGSQVDTNVLASMLTAVLDFMKDSMRTPDGVSGFDYGSRRIMIAIRGRLILAVALYGRETTVLRGRVDSTLERVEKRWPGPTEKWDGSAVEFEGVRSQLTGLLGTRRG